MSTHRQALLVSAFAKLFKNKLATACAVFLVLEIILLALGPLIAPFSPDETNVAIKFSPGIWAKFSRDASYAAKYVPGHIFGTDHLGRDVFSRLVIGGRVSLMVGFVSTALGLVVGTFLGLLAGYYKRLDNPIMRLMDILFTFPGILLAMLIVALLGVSTFNAMLAISIWSIPNFARMVRGRALQIKEEDYILAVRATGAKDGRILFIHILKNCLPLIIVIATMRMATSIISISTLSYLGMGVPPPAPEWGSMIAQAKEYMWKMPSLIFIPGIAVMLTVISFNILGDKLRDILDPSLKD
jgi:peptide/nickel transport system permease protein